MSNVNRLRYAPLKEILKSGLTSALALALMGGTGLPVQAQQEPMPPAGAIGSAEAAEALATLNLNDDYYTMEQGSHATFYPFENDQYNSSEVGQVILTVSPCPEIVPPMSVNWFMPILNNQRVLMMQFHTPPAGDYTVTYEITPANDSIPADQATIHLHVFDPADRQALYLPNLQNATAVNESTTSDE